MLSQEDFIERSKKAQKVVFDYSETVYTGMANKVTVICPNHGAFEQSSQSHVNGANGCTGCGHRGRKDVVNNEKFINKAKLVHGNKIDYSDTVYTIMKNKIEARCVEHDLVFSQLPQAHLKGLNGCPECNGQSPITLSKFIKKSKDCFGVGKFKYDKVVGIKNMHSKVELFCIEHGKSFVQSINTHLRGANGCPSCNHFSRRVGDKLDTLIKNVNKDGRYDYSKTDFTILYPAKITITCKTHSVDFEQTLNGHLSGKDGCSKCSMNGTSKQEEAVAEFVESLGFTIVRNDRKILKGKELDIVVESKKVAIEFNGIYWHSEKFVGRLGHFQKFENAKNAGYRLLQIWEDDWVARRSIVESHIKSVLGVSGSKRVFARKCAPVTVDSIVAKSFLNNNHVQGFVGASHYVGLEHNGEIVALAAFLKSGNDFTLVRYATSCSVIGGHSKLVSYFEKNYSYNKLITFADRTFSNGDLYRQTGWVVDGEVPADYYYIVDNVRFHKFGFRKERFKKDPNLIFETGKTESELAVLNRLDRIWDAGKVRFIKTHP